MKHFFGLSASADDLQKLKDFEQRHRVYIDIWTWRIGDLSRFVSSSHLQDLDVDGILVVESSYDANELEYAQEYLRCQGVRLYGVQNGLHPL